VDTGETNDEIVTESPNRVVGAPRRYFRERMVCKVWNLCREEVTNQTLVYLDLVFVHSHQSECLTTSRRVSVEGCHQRADL
jgi:hypothetical protein